MRLFYVSVTSFSDTDLPILAALSINYEVIYCLLFQKRNANFKVDEVRRFCEERKIAFIPVIFRHSQKDLRSSKKFALVFREIFKSRPDAIYICAFYHPTFSLLGLVLKRNKTIIAVHDAEFHSKYFHRHALQFGRSILMTHFHNFIVFSKVQQEIFVKRYPDKNVTMLPMPLIDVGEKKLVSKGSTVNFLFFGNILPYKGLDILLKAINSLTDRSLPFKLVIAGRCDFWETEYRPILPASDQVVSIIRHIDNSEVSMLFSKADYLILPYRDATQSGPLMLAYNYDVPVICSSIPAFKELVIENVTGLFFDPEDANSLAEVLENAIRHHNKLYPRLTTTLKNFVNEQFRRNQLQGKLKSCIDGLFYAKS